MELVKEEKNEKQSGSDCLEYWAKFLVFQT